MSTILNPEFIIFVIYLIMLVGIGLYFYKKTSSIEGFLLGDRGLGQAGLPPFLRRPAT